FVAGLGLAGGDGADNDPYVLAELDRRGTVAARQKERGPRRPRRAFAFGQRLESAPLGALERRVRPRGAEIAGLRPEAGHAHALDRQTSRDEGRRRSGGQLRSDRGKALPDQGRRVGRDRRQSLYRGELSLVTGQV